jgi:4-carboxymuconolactone decarboxylase
MPRIQPIAAKTDLAPENQYVFDQVMGVFGRIRGPFGVLLHSPKLAERLLPMVPFAREGTMVEPQLRQIAVLAAVREREADYVWAAQVDAARRVGLREAVIDLLRAKGDPAGLPPDERDIVVYARQLMRTNRVDQAVFAALKERHGVQWLVELTAVANFYVALCGVVNAFEVPAPADGDRFAQQDQRQDQ